jgi:hypothetical protein
MELPSRKIWRARALVGVGRWKDQDSPNSPSPEQGEGSGSRASGRTLEEHLGFNKTVDKVRLAPLD